MSHRLRSSSEGTAAQGGISTGADGVTRFFTIAEVAEIIQVAPRSVRRWITALDFHGRFTVIQHAAPAAVAEFRTEARQGRDQLHRLRRTLVENEQERDDFKKRNRLRRAPRVSSSVTVFLKVTLLVFLMVSETYINAIFLAKGNALGFIGGAAEALVFAILNVLVSFGIGLGGLRQFNHRKPVPKNPRPAIASGLARIRRAPKCRACSLSRSVRCTL